MGFRIKALDILIIAAALGLSVFLIFRSPGDRPKKLTLISGDEKITLPYRDRVVDFLEDFYDAKGVVRNIGKDMRLEIKDGRARMIYSDCPDKVCVRSGWAENCGDMIICMPNSTAIIIDCQGALDENK